MRPLWPAGNAKPGGCSDGRTGLGNHPAQGSDADQSRVTDDDALALARILDGSANTRAALVALMKAIARYGRPSSLPDDVRAAWDDCENIVGDDTMSELLAVASHAVREREHQRPTRRRPPADLGSSDSIPLVANCKAYQTEAPAGRQVR